MPRSRRVVAATSDVPSAEYITTLVELLPTSIVRFRSHIIGQNYEIGLIFRRVFKNVKIYQLALFLHNAMAIMTEYDLYGGAGRSEAMKSRGPGKCSRENPKRKPPCSKSSELHRIRDRRFSRWSAPWY